MSIENDALVVDRIVDAGGDWPSQSETRAAEIKKLRHQIGVSEQNYRLTYKARHWDKARECKARLKELLA